MKEEISLDREGTLKFNERICVPNDEGIKKMILEEAHKRKLSIYPDIKKMFQDLKKMIIISLFDYSLVQISWSRYLTSTI